MSERPYSVKGFAEHYGVSEHHVRNMIHEGRLEAFRAHKKEAADEIDRQAAKIECCEVVERLNHIEQKLDMMVNIICACDDAFRGLYVQEYAGLSNRLALEQKGQHSRASEASED